MRLGVAARQAREHDPSWDESEPTPDPPQEVKPAPRLRIDRPTMRGKGACS